MLKVMVMEVIKSCIATVHVHDTMPIVTKDVIKGAQTYCIINEWDQPATKECNIKLYYRQKLEKLFYASENGTLTVSDYSTTRVPKSSRGFLELTVRNGENIRKELPSC